MAGISKGWNGPENFMEGVRLKLGSWTVWKEGRSVGQDKNLDQEGSNGNGGKGQVS